ncbi:beta-N-acetylglucosaminidase domain-containing protein [Microbacterium sp. T2.11-28]|uniref:beta-N-acetylglucosaminidase domain-containing protein n=1 Tax=Microbacterium sp. T2.11-28 TaxID=3041169 RepID=UPI002477C1FA|nr:beta-N-acetylglucosaminidase domain-containing protein [Microbacterium sp. T2.11-28]CAI9390714.1 O-GlcNAcase NagJ [Microbacterium sp. T2.11-28]
MVKDARVPLELLPQPAAVGGPSPTGAVHPVRDVVRHLDPRLAPEGYRLHAARGLVTVTASDARGTTHAETTLDQLTRRFGGIPDLEIDDAPTLAHRGIIEGFYGEPWSDEERIATFRLARRVKLTSYVYAPKDDPYHRVRWREPYPAAELARLQRLADAAHAEGIDFVFALHPAGSMVFSDDAEHELLAAKAAQLVGAGIGRFALLFDDVPPEPVHDADVAAFGAGGAGLGAAHAAAVRRFVRDVQEPRGLPLPIVVPTDYAGIHRSDYREAFAAGVPAHVLVWWTGRDIVVGEISRDDIDAAADVFGDRLALWDNFPVNDFDRGRAFLGPLTGRTGDVAGSALRGAWTNPMVECAPGWFGIAAFADWAWNPAGYDPARAARVTLDLVGGADAERLAPLVRTLSSWPPSATMDPELRALTRGVLAGDAEASAALRERLDELAALDRALAGAGAEPARSLRPWAEAAAHMARAGRDALDLLEGRPGADPMRTRAALELALSHPAKVATDVIPDFVREVLAADEG